MMKSLLLCALFAGLLSAGDRDKAIAAKMQEMIAQKEQVVAQAFRSPCNVQTSHALLDDQSNITVPLAFVRRQAMNHGARPYGPQ